MAEMFMTFVLVVGEFVVVGVTLNYLITKFVGINVAAGFLNWGK